MECFYDFSLFFTFKSCFISQLIFRMFKTSLHGKIETTKADILNIEFPWLGHGP